MAYLEAILVSNGRVGFEAAPRSQISRSTMQEDARSARSALLDRLAHRADVVGRYQLVGSAERGRMAGVVHERGANLARHIRDAPDEQRIVGFLRRIEPHHYRAVFGPGGARLPRTGATLVTTRRPGLELVVSPHKSVAELGVAYATLQCAELLARGAPGIHFYTLNRSPATRAILSALKLLKPWVAREVGAPASS